MNIDQREEEKKHVQKHLARLFQDVFGIDEKRIKVEDSVRRITVRLANGAFPNGASEFRMEYEKVPARDIDPGLPSGDDRFLSIHAVVQDWAEVCEKCTLSAGDEEAQRRRKDFIIRIIQEKTGLRAEAEPSTRRIGF